MLGTVLDSEETTMSTLLQEERVRRGEINNQETQGGSVVKNRPVDAGDAGEQVRSLGWEDSLEYEMATHCSILALGIPWTEEPGGLHSMGLQRVGDNSATEYAQEDNLRYS